MVTSALAYVPTVTLSAEGKRCLSSLFHGKDGAKTKKSMSRERSTHAELQFEKVGHCGARAWSLLVAGWHTRVADKEIRSPQGCQ